MQSFAELFFCCSDSRLLDNMVFCQGAVPSILSVHSGCLITCNVKHSSIFSFGDVGCSYASETKSERRFINFTLAMILSTA